MYRNTRSRVRVNGSFSDDLLVQVGQHEGSVSARLLFIIMLIMLEAFCTEIRVEMPRIVILY